MNEKISRTTEYSDATELLKEQAELYRLKVKAKCWEIYAAKYMEARAREPLHNDGNHLAIIRDLAEKQIICQKYEIEHEYCGGRE